MENDNTELDLKAIEKFSEYVQTYTESLGIDFHKPPDDIQDILGASREELKKMSPTDLNTWAFSLSSYAFGLQKEINETKAKRDWCDHVMNHLIAKYYDRELYVGYHVRRKMAALEVNDSFGTKVEKIFVYMEARLTLLNNKVEDIRKMAETLNQIARRKDYA